MSSERRHQNNENLNFGQRMGFEKVRDALQVRAMDSRLRNALWSDIHHLLESLSPGQYLAPDCDLYGLLAFLKVDYFGEPVDSIDRRTPFALNELRQKFMAAQWYEVYSIVEKVVRYFDNRKKAQEPLITLFNAALQREGSAYRFIGATLSPITDEVEVAEIEVALTGAPATVAQHLRAALEKLSNRDNPDYRNSVKESVGAVEAAVRQITGDKNAMLSKALGSLEPKPHPSLQKAFEKIYAYAGDEEGVRHSLKDGTSVVGEAEARFMLVACSAFVNYLRLRSNKVMG